MKDVFNFFLLSRPVNVVITLIAFALGCFLALGKSLDFFEDLNFWLGGGVLMFIAATGYWINDAFDFKIDRINRPGKVIVNAHLSVKKVLTLYFIVNVGILITSFLLQDLALFFVNLSASTLLFLYAAFLKRTTAIGNLLIAALTALVVYYAALIYGLKVPLLWMIVFAFEVTFLREVVKDIEDIEGDLHFKLQTLPIRVGIVVTKQLLYFAFGLFLLSCYGPAVHEFLLYQKINWPYIITSLILVQVPTVFLIVKLKKAKEEPDFKRLSNYLKLLIFLGMSSLLLLK